MFQPENTLAEAIVDEMGTKWRLNNLVFMDEDIGFVYFSAPGVANVRTIGSLQKGVALVRGVRYDIPDIGRVLNRPEGLVANPRQSGMTKFNQMLEDESVIRLAFVRDPAERFAAAYRNQFSINTKFSDHRVKLFSALGMPLEENLSMLDLAELLSEERELTESTPQLVPQRKLIAYDLVDYTFIGNHERWEADFPNISIEIFGCETPVFDPVKELSIDPEGAALAANVSAETRTALKTAYAQDYEMIDEINALFPGGFAQDL